jgi:hypothetical protein
MRAMGIETLKVSPMRAALPQGIIRIFPPCSQSPN